MKPLLGLFDSGLGGLTVLRRVLERHGAVSCIYLGDTARVPYGGRDVQELRQIAAEVVGWLRDQQVSTVVMACNTTNALAKDVAEAVAAGPVIGLIEAASSMVRTSRVGVLATAATAASGVYRSCIEATRPGTLVVEQACPSFVPLIERGDFACTELREAAETYLAPLLEASVDSIVLGCTHYPLLAPLLTELLPETVELIDPAVGVARELDAGLGTAKPLSSGRSALERCRFCVTADGEGFADRAAPWLGERPLVHEVVLRSREKGH